ncbi:VOC family protein [Gymnodinialimonas ceratoperidinii]|uniref:VOC family protein n=1 Tax=Gymnodinialimonas ceratoperidinii TaxID=2856823 RepID=A0A8F6TWB4_9RHOB|nr:VOC family protein [Gymnodinialimonas ceratoperidinii]QXT40136.1 VOC family protein [Gymnodinialimonas ceratoperidinii]
MTPPFRIRALGEIAIRCDDLARMAAFYGEMLGLQRLEGNAAPGIIFFRIAEGFGGHTQVLALFDKTMGAGPDAPRPTTGAGSALHHIALTVPFHEQEAVMAWYDEHDQPYRIENFGWVGWRGIFTTDPEGNTVELVAYDDSLKT